MSYVSTSPSPIVRATRIGGGTHFGRRGTYLTCLTLVACVLFPITRQSKCMTALIRYDAARRALAAAHSVDEVRAIRSRAEAVRVYAKQARDLDMQNMAAEIRIHAERRAGQLLLEMEKNPGTRGEGRPRKDDTKSRRSRRTTANPPTLEEIGISKDQSAKWQKIALLVDDATFEKALAKTDMAILYLASISALMKSAASLRVTF